MVQQYVSQHDGCGNWFRLYYKDLQNIVSQFNNNRTVQANGLSISLTGDAESYAYYAVLEYKGVKIGFLIYQNLGWDLVDVILASREKEYAYFTAWNLWVKLSGFKG